MKSLLSFLVLWIFCFTTTAQNKTWIGTSGSAFNVASNWNPAGVPTSVNDVIIPTASNVLINSNIEIKSISLAGNAVVTVTGNISSTGASTIAQNATFTLNSGYLMGSGTYTNNGTINDNGMTIANTTTIVNNGIYNVGTDGTHYIGGGTPTLNNTTTGTINLNLNSGSFGGFSGQGTIINSGVINRVGTGAFTIYIILENNNGTINVQNGTLTISNTATKINGGIFNVTAGKTMDLNSDFTCTQTITGLVNGALNWNGNLIVETGNQAILNFTTGNKISWNSGSFRGNGTLKNTGTINVVTASSKSIYNSAILNNEGTFNINGTGVFYLANTSRFNNLTTGQLNISTSGSMQAASGSGTLTNTGLIKKTADNSFTIYIVSENNAGTMLVEGGALNFDNTYNKLNGGTYTVKAAGTLNWDGNHTCTGILTGQINGALNWNGTLTVALATQATLNFTTNGVRWNSGSFTGNGTLKNTGIVNLETASSKSIYGTSVFDNEATFNINALGVFYLANSSTFNNLSSGTFNIKSSGSIQAASGSGTLKNTGLIKKTTTGVFTIYTVSENNNGTVLVENGALTYDNSTNKINSGTYTVNTAGTLNWDGTHTLTGTLVGQINGALNWNGSLTVAPTVTATINFTTNGVRWNSGSLTGNGTLSNIGIVNLETTSSKSIYGSTTFKNQANVTINNSGVFYLANTSTFNNVASGVFTINSIGSIQAASGAGTLINIGLIKKTAAGAFTIYIVLENNNGNFLVEEGTLTYSNSATKLNNGTYTVNTAGILNWNDTVTCTGTLVGVINGDLNWNGTLSVASGTTATLNFTTNGVSWNSGSFSGNGTLTNAGIINLKTTSSKSIYGSSMFNNQAAFNINDVGVFYLANTSTFKNLPTGIFSINSTGSIQAASGAGTLINTGLLKKVTNAGAFTIYNPTTNTLPGIIQATTGTLNITGAYTGNGILTGNGTVNLSNSPFNGTIKPGGTPGTLNYLGNYVASTATIMEVDLNGTTPSTGYDVLTVQNSATAKGTIIVNLGFAPTLNSEFVILTATNVTCTLPATVSAIYNGYQYVFNVICNPTNVTLKVASVTLDTNESTLSAISLYPNPTLGQFTIDLGKEYEAVTVQIYSTIGQLISSSNYNATDKVSQEITAAAGIYFVKVTSDNKESKMIRIIKQ